MLIPPSSLLNGLRLPPYNPVLDLEPRLRCRECDARGKVVVSIKWAGDWPAGCDQRRAASRRVPKADVHGSHEPPAPRDRGYVCLARQYFGLAAQQRQGRRGCRAPRSGCVLTRLPSRAFKRLYVVVAHQYQKSMPVHRLSINFMENLIFL